MIGKLLDYYKNRKFKVNGEFDQTPNPVIFKNIFSKENSKICTAKTNKIFYLSDSSVIYPIGYFCRRQKFCKNFALHHFYGSWKTEKKAIFKTLLRLGDFEIIKSKTPHKCTYPPTFDKDIKELLSFEYKYRRRIHLIARRDSS